MRKSALVIGLLFFIALTSMAQDAGAGKKELGIFISESNFGIRYKTGNENLLTRLTLFTINGSRSTIQTNPDQKNISGSFGFGFAAGLEKRRPLSEGLCLYAGPELIGGYNLTVHKSKPSTGYYRQNGFSAGLGFVMGFQFSITDRINISSEIIPHISYYYTKESNEYDEIEDENIYNGLSYGLNDYSINVTVSFNL